MSVADFVKASGKRLSQPDSRTAARTFDHISVEFIWLFTDDLHLRVVWGGRWARYKCLIGNRALVARGEIKERKYEWEWETQPSDELLVEARLLGLL